jgi:hypothetical protein
MSSQKTRTRPQSIAEVALRILENGHADMHLREFLDSFYLARQNERPQMIGKEPASTGKQEYDAYLAATAEKLSDDYNIPTPEWVHGDTRFLKRPYFPDRLEQLKPYLIVESPTQFRRRLIFVTRNVLSRPRMSYEYETADQG